MAVPLRGARQAQVLRITQTGEDRWQADFGDGLVVAEGPMASYQWITGMMGLAAAAAAAKLNPVGLTPTPANRAERRRRTHAAQAAWAHVERSEETNPPKIVLPGRDTP